ncbi:phosphoseryl-tRNA kinase [Phyllostomus discolor]|nr:phosphoseryl-tRNA kinase [Phyllostomus discolor]
MARKIEEPNPKKNAWEHNSLTVQSPACSSAASPALTDLLLAALENPVRYVEENVEQKETDRIVCSTNILHQADQMLRRIVSQTMKEAKGTLGVFCENRLSHQGNANPNHSEIPLHTHETPRIKKCKCC